MGEATAWVLGPGISSSDLVLTRLTSPVMFKDNPSSIGVVTLGASLRSFFQLAEIIGLSFGGEWSGVSLGVGDTCQSLSAIGVVGAGVWDSVVWGELVRVGVFSWGGVDDRLSEPSEDRLMTDVVDSVDVLVATGWGTWVDDCCWKVVSVGIVELFAINILW